MKSIRNRLRSYRLTLSDESRLRRVASVEMPLWQWIMAIVALCALLACLVGTLFYFSPLRNGADTQTREETIESMLRLDSLQRVLERDHAFVENFLTVTNTGREPSDSASLVVNPRPLTADSVMARTPEEDKFIKMVEQREKYNLSILAPLAAEGMMLNPLSDEQVITEKSRRSRRAEVIVPHDSPVGAIADGVVVDVYYSPREGGNVIVMQHGKGFVSRVGRIGNLLVSKDDQVQAGQIIGFPATGNGINGSRVYLEIWRNGDALVPFELLGR